MKRSTQLLLAAAGLALGAMGAAAGPADAQIEGDCTATVAGRDVETATSPSSAIEVAADDVVRVEGVDPNGAPFTVIELRFPPLPAFEVYNEEHDAADPSWGGEVNVADYAVYGVGLYQVSGGTDDCRGTAWIKVTGRSPFTTVAGGIGTALAAAGAIGAGISIARAQPGWRSFFHSASRGALLGVGVAILAQQFALTPLTGVALAGWVGAGLSVSGLANLGVAALRSGASTAVSVGPSA